MRHRRNRFHIECQASPFCTSRPSRAGPHTGTRRNTMPCPSEWERSDNQILLDDLRGFGIRFTGVLGNLAFRISGGKFCKASVAVAIHRVAEHLRLSEGNKVLVHQREDAVTGFLEFNFHCDGVLPRVSGLPFVALDLFLLLHAGDEAPSCTSTSNGALVCDLQQIPLLDRKLRWLFAHLLHALRHSIMAFRLLSGTRLRYHHVRW